MDPLSIAASVVQITAYVLATTGLIIKVVEGVRDRDRVQDFLVEVETCTSNLLCIEETFKNVIHEWIKHDPPQRTRRAISTNTKHINKMVNMLSNTLSELFGELLKINESSTPLSQYLRSERKQSILVDRRERMKTYTHMLTLSMSLINMTIQVNGQTTNQNNHQEVIRRLNEIRSSASPSSVEVSLDSEDYRAFQEAAKVAKTLVDSIEPEVNESSSTSSHDSTYSSMQQRPASPPPMIRYDPGLWDPDLQRQFMSEAIELVEISVSKKEWPEACKHQEKVLEVAGTILRTHGGANCDPRVNIPTLEQELAGFFYAAGEHERCIKLLKKLLDSNPLRKLDAGTQWKLLYDISKAYNGKQKFHEAAAHGQEAWGKAEKYFLPQDERITATAKLLVDIFHQNDDLARGNAFKRRLEKHESFQKFASKYPEYSLVLTPSGISPVIQAAKDGHANTVRKFLEELPVWRDEIDKSGATVLICAASNKHLDVIRKLQIEPPQFAFGISASTTDLSCETALHRAMRRPPLESNFSKCYPASNWMSSAKEIVRILLDADADTRIQNTDGETCAHICVQNGHTDILRMLLTRNPELISIADSERRTLLHTAIETGQEDLIPILLDEYDADIWFKDKDAYSCVDRANDPSLMNINITKLINGAKERQKNKTTPARQDSIATQISQRPVSTSKSTSMLSKFLSRKR